MCIERHECVLKGMSVYCCLYICIHYIYNSLSEKAVALGIVCDYELHR